MAEPIMRGAIDLTFTYRNRANTNSDAHPLATPANYMSPATLDAALKTANATYYTDALLNKLSINDKVFALRQINDSGTI